MAIDAVEGIVVVASQATDFDCTIGFNVMENIFQAQPDIGVVFAHNDKIFLGQLKRLKLSIARLFQFI